MKSFPLNLPEKWQKRLKETIDRLRTGRINRCDGHEFICHTDMWDIEGAEVWRWQNYYLLYMEDPETGKPSYELWVEARAQPEELSALTVLNTGKQNHVSRETRRHREAEKAPGKKGEQKKKQAPVAQPSGEATVTYLNGKGLYNDNSPKFRR